MPSIMFENYWQPSQIKPYTYILQQASVLGLRVSVRDEQMCLLT